MALRKISMRRWEQLTAESERRRAELIGWSTGAAADALGMTRQGVHKAVRRGDLDAVMVQNDEGKLLAFMIPSEAIEAFKASKRRYKNAS